MDLPNGSLCAFRKPNWIIYNFLIDFTDILTCIDMTGFQIIEFLWHAFILVFSIHAAMKNWFIFNILIQYLNIKYCCKAGFKNKTFEEIQRKYIQVITYSTNNGQNNREYLKNHPDMRSKYPSNHIIFIKWMR